MAKPCVLNDNELATTLTQIPSELLTTQDSYALHLIAHNTLKPEAERQSFTAIAEQVNHHFGNSDVKPLSAAKLGKLLKNHDATLETLFASLEAAHEASREPALPAAETAPAPEIAQSSPQPSDLISNYMHPAIALGTLSLMELTAHIRGDTHTESALASINKELSGKEDYKNPLIAATQMPKAVQQDVAKRMEQVSQRGRSLWTRVTEMAASAQASVQSVAEVVSKRAQQDIKIVQAATYMPEITKAQEGAGTADRLAVIESLRKAAARG